MNFNLPPDIRTRLSNIIPLGLIPGPKSPVDFDSFARHFIDECKILASSGVRAWDACANEGFTHRAYPISTHADMPACKHCNYLSTPWVTGTPLEPGNGSSKKVA
jgi:hypothetical protein